MKQSTGLPAKITLPFGANAAAGLIRQVPTASQIGIVNGAASYNDGFPPLTNTALASGGIPPAIQDFNGLLNQMSAWDLWTAAAGITPYDATFQAAIGGYPQNALVSTAVLMGASAVPGRVWISTVDNNLTNPDTGGAGWLYLTLPSDVLALTAQTPAAKNLVSKSVAGTYTFTVPSKAAGAANDVFWIYGTCVGAGGGGAGQTSSSTRSAGGGGAGGTAAGWFSVTPGQVITYVIGAGGAGCGDGAIASTGGTSSIGSIMQASGGTGGRNVTNNCAGGTPGVGSGGQLNLYGSNGGDGNGVRSDGQTIQGGAGGASSQGGGGRTAVGGGSTTNGTAPGSGAGGCWGAGGTFNGGNGADGFVSFQY